MADQEKKEITEVAAFARGVHISPRKARLVADLLKKSSAEAALRELRFLTKKAALPIRKLLDSAIANASHNFQLGLDELYIKSLTVDGGPTGKRYKPHAQGRAFPIRKQTSHINLILGVNKKIKNKAVKRVVKPAAEAPVKGEILEEAPKEEKSGFWKRKRTKDPSQLPAKQDPKGKHYTGFDRRGNMGA